MMRPTPSADLGVDMHLYENNSPHCPRTTETDAAPRSVGSSTHCLSLDAMSPSFLAAYGTLMRSVGGPEPLGGADQGTFVAECRFAGLLYDLGRFPGATPGDGIIHGELSRLHDPQAWTALDRYEGYDPDHEPASLFVRRRVTLEHPADQTAWVYWYNGDVSGHPRVPSGNWAVYVDTGAQE